MKNKVMAYHAETGVIPELPDHIKYGLGYLQVNDESIKKIVDSIFTGYEAIQFNQMEMTNWEFDGITSQAFEARYKKGNSIVYVRFYVPVIEPYSRYNDMATLIPIKKNSALMRMGKDILLVTLKIKLVFKPTLVTYHSGDLLEVQSIHLFSMYEKTNANIPLELFGWEKSDYNIVVYNNLDKNYVDVVGVTRGEFTITCDPNTPTELIAAIFHAAKYVELSLLNRASSKFLISILTYSSKSGVLSKSLTEIRLLTGLYDIIDDLTAEKLGVKDLKGVYELIKSDTYVEMFHYDVLYYIMYDIIDSINRNTRDKRYVSKKKLFGLSSNLCYSVNNCTNNIVQNYTTLSQNQNNGAGVRASTTANRTYDTIAASDIVTTSLLSAKKSYPTNGSLNMFLKLKNYEPVMDEAREAIAYLEQLIN